MGSPALQGFDTFLRYRSGGEAVAENTAQQLAGAKANESPIGASHCGLSPTSVSPPGLAPGGTSDIDNTPPGSMSIAEFRPPPRVRRALKAQDGHSTGEQAVYEALWNVASVETAETRMIRI